MQRPTVDLPEPDSPTRPSVRPAQNLQGNAGHGLHDDLAAAPAHGEVLHEIADLERRRFDGRHALSPDAETGK